MSPSGPRPSGASARSKAKRTATAPLEIAPLTSERLPDLAQLFARGDQRWCWCTYFRVRGTDWSNTTPEGNREILTDAVRRLAGEGRAPGLVAYRDGEPVGWVSLGPREDYERLQHSPVLAPVDAHPVWSIVCFVVAPKARGQGVASTLLDAAVAYARDHGASLLEGYPVETSGARLTSSSIYRGTLSMFEKHGFEVVARRRANRISAPRPIVRRRVRRAARPRP